MPSPSNNKFVRIPFEFDATLYIRATNRAKKNGMATGEEYASSLFSSLFLPDNIAPTPSGKSLANAKKRRNQ